MITDTMSVHYEIQRQAGSKWEVLAQDENLEEIQLALADAGRFPMNSTLRIVKVTQEVVL